MRNIENLSTGQQVLEAYLKHESSVCEIGPDQEVNNLTLTTLTETGYTDDFSKHRVIRFLKLGSRFICAVWDEKFTYHFGIFGNRPDNSAVHVVRWLIPSEGPISTIGYRQEEDGKESIKLVYASCWLSSWLINNRRTKETEFISHLKRGVSYDCQTGGWLETIHDYPFGRLNDGVVEDLKFMSEANRMLKVCQKDQGQILLLSFLASQPVEQITLPETIDANHWKSIILGIEQAIEDPTYPWQNWQRELGMSFSANQPLEIVK